MGLEQSLKAKMYEVLHSQIPQLTDSPPEVVKKTYVLYSISDAFDERLKLGVRQTNTYITFDIFSVYDGDKEVLEIKDKIDEILQNSLYTLGTTSYFALSGFNIINEEKPLRKHGVLRYRILSTH